MWRQRSSAAPQLICCNLAIFLCVCVWGGVYVCVSPDAQFVRVAPLSETDNPEDDKVYVFFTERAQEAEGAAGKVLYSRVARVCKVRCASSEQRWNTDQTRGCLHEVFAEVFSCECLRAD